MVLKFRFYNLKCYGDLNFRVGMFYISIFMQNCMVKNVYES